MSSSESLWRTHRIYGIVHIETDEGVEMYRFKTCENCNYKNNHKHQLCTQCGKNLPKIIKISSKAVATSIILLGILGSSSVLANNIFRNEYSNQPVNESSHKPIDDIDIAPSSGEDIDANQNSEIKEQASSNPEKQILPELQNKTSNSPSLPSINPTKSSTPSTLKPEPTTTSSISPSTNPSSKPSPITSAVPTPISTPTTVIVHYRCKLINIHANLPDEEDLSKCQSGYYPSTDNLAVPNVIPPDAIWIQVP